MRGDISISLSIEDTVQVDAKLYSLPDNEQQQLKQKCAFAYAIIKSEIMRKLSSIESSNENDSNAQGMHEVWVIIEIKKEK